MRRELADSAKDDAELSMIVDLLRNDLGKVCRAGSVRVVEHKRLEAWRNVYHLVSRVEGDLDADQNQRGPDPRRLSGRLHHRLPQGACHGDHRRTGTMPPSCLLRQHRLYRFRRQRMDLSIAIRTAVVTGGRICFSVGGGIVLDSDPRAEYEETLHKARTLLAATTPGGP
jgi:para-aminobenzoate synthetase component I